MPTPQRNVHPPHHLSDQFCTTPTAVTLARACCSWSQYWPGTCAREPKDFPANLATHINYAFVFMNKSESRGPGRRMARSTQGQPTGAELLGS